MLDDFEISINGFRLLEINGGIDLTTAESVYNREPQIGNGGIAVSPNAVDINVESGKLLITQLCTHHKFEVKMLDKWHKFFSDGEIFNDTNSPNNSHYESYNIIDKKVCNGFGTVVRKIEFWDAPYVELLNSWTEIKYEIKFKTWFQIYDNSNNSLIPISCFEWFLNAHALKENNKWTILSQSYSDQEMIRKSLRKCNLNEPGIVTCKLRQIASIVREFRNKEHIDEN